MSSILALLLFLSTLTCSFHCHCPLSCSYACPQRVLTAKEHSFTSLSLWLQEKKFPRNCCQFPVPQRDKTMKQISKVEEKPPMSSLNISPKARVRICKRLWSPGIDSKESIPPAYVACSQLIRVYFI